MRLLVVITILGVGMNAQSRAEYVGGTAAKLESGVSGAIQVTDERYFAFYTKKTQVRVAYDHINELQYGQKVDRRLLMAVVISPVFLLSKKRKHFLTVGYTDDDGRQQALVGRRILNHRRGFAVYIVDFPRRGRAA